MPNNQRQSFTHRRIDFIWDEESESYLAGPYNNQPPPSNCIRWVRIFRKGPSMWGITIQAEDFRSEFENGRETPQEAFDSVLNYLLVLKASQYNTLRRYMGREPLRFDELEGA